MSPEGFIQPGNVGTAYATFIIALLKITNKDYAHFLYVQYMEKYFDGQHVGSSIGTIRIGSNLPGEYVLSGAPHRYRYQLRGALLGFNQDLTIIEGFNITSKGNYSLPYTYTVL